MQKEGSSSPQLKPSRFGCSGLGIAPWSEDPQPYMGYRDLLPGDLRLPRHNGKVRRGSES